MISHRGTVVWLTGLSGAGKSTIASGTCQRLLAAGLSATVIDGDILRASACRDLGFSAADRRENIRRAGRIALECAANGQIALVALISPFDDARLAVERECREAGTPFALVFVDAPLDCCERRDPKGLYRRARSGAIAQFTGISSDYERPAAPDLTIRSDREPVGVSVDRVVRLAQALANGSAPCVGAAESGAKDNAVFDAKS